MKYVYSLKELITIKLFIRLYGLESDMYMALRKYINGENKQGRKLRSTDMISMEVNVLYIKL